MQRSVLGMCFLLMLAAATASAQAPGRLTVSVTSAPRDSAPAAPVAGAKIIVVHWVHAQLHPSMVQEAVATTGQMGTANLELPPGTYDVFVTASGLAPAAFSREIVSAAT